MARGSPAPGRLGTAARRPGRKGFVPARTPPAGRRRPIGRGAFEAPHCFGGSLIANTLEAALFPRIDTVTWRHDLGPGDCPRTARDHDESDTNGDGSRASAPVAIGQLSCTARSIGAGKAYGTSGPSGPNLRVAQERVAHLLRGGEHEFDVEIRVPTAEAMSLPPRRFSGDRTRVL